MTPVAIVRPARRGRHPRPRGDAQGVRRGGYPPASQRPLALSSLAPPAVEPLQLKGTTLTLTASSTIEVVEVKGPEGSFPPPTGELAVSVTMPDGQRLSRDLGVVPLAGGTAARLSAPLLCPSGCRLDGITFRLHPPVPYIDASGQGSITLTGLSIDGKALPVNTADVWQAAADVAGAPDDYLRVGAQTGADRLVLETHNTGVVLRLGYADVPTLVPAILSGPIPPGGTPQQFQASGINGIPTTMTRTQQVPAVPVLGAQGAVVNFETLARLGGRIPGAASLQAWLGTDSPAAVERVRTALSASGINVLSVHRADEVKQGYDRSASGWGLQLALVTGVLALLMAALALIVVAVDRVALRRPRLRGDAHGRRAPARAAAGRPARAARAWWAWGWAWAPSAAWSARTSPCRSSRCSTSPRPVPAPDLSPAWPAVAGASLVALGLLTVVGAAHRPRPRCAVHPRAHQGVPVSTPGRPDGQHHRAGAHLPRGGPRRRGPLRRRPRPSAPGRWSACSAPPGAGKSTLLTPLRRPPSGRAPGGSASASASCRR